MLPASAERILERLDEGDLVLDVGGWAVPFGRADWVLDLMPYESRGSYGNGAGGPERFSEGTWIERDICSPEPWPFDDNRFDFAICSQTLEDVRDPIRVCAELNRVARGGYIEVPSRLEEQSLGVHGDWAGYSHHHWLCDVTPGRIEFVFKSHALHSIPAFHFPAGFAQSLRPERRVQQLWWAGGFEYSERIFLDTGEHDEYLASFVSAHSGAGSAPRPSLRSRLLRRLAG